MQPHISHWEFITYQQRSHYSWLCFGFLCKIVQLTSRRCSVKHGCLFVSSSFCLSVPLSVPIVGLRIWCSVCLPCPSVRLFVHNCCDCWLRLKLYRCPLRCSTKAEAETEEVREVSEDGMISLGDPARERELELVVFQINIFGFFSVCRLLYNESLVQCFFFSFFSLSFLSVILSQLIVVSICGMELSLSRPLAPLLLSITL